MTGTMPWSLAKPPFPKVTRTAVTIYTTGATASTSKSAFAFLTILALSGNISPRRVRIQLKRLVVDSQSLLAHTVEDNGCVFSISSERFDGDGIGAGGTL